MVIKWLYDNYVGLRSSKITVPATEKTWPFVKFVKVNVVRVKAARIMFPFFVLWGAYKVWQSTAVGELYWSWLVDFPMLLLLAVQYIAGFTNIVKHAYEKNNNQ